MSLQVTERPKRIIKITEVINKTALCKSAIYVLISEGDFPKQIPLGTRAVGWLESSVDQWIDERVAMSHTGVVSA